jgi:hypothetical protein
MGDGPDFAFKPLKAVIVESADRCLRDSRESRAAAPNASSAVGDCLPREPGR